MKKILIALFAVFAFVGLTACSSEADTVSHNLSKEADDFKIKRRIVFYNGITDTYILVIEGRCSVGNNDKKGRTSVTCKISKGNKTSSYKKHYLKTSDNVTWFAEQLEGASVSAYHYQVDFKPQSIVPDIDAKLNLQDGPDKQ